MMRTTESAPGLERRDRSNTPRSHALPGILFLVAAVLVGGATGVRAAQEPPIERARSRAASPQARPQSGNQTATSRPARDKGCGDRPTKLDMNPPPPDKPQPRWVCEQPVAEIEPVWTGKEAEFVFKVTNGGQGVLNIKVGKP